MGASSWLLACWSTVCRVLDARMQQKYKFLGRGDSSLTNLIHQDVLPRSLGGTHPEWSPPDMMSRADALGIFADMEPETSERRATTASAASSIGQNSPTSRSCTCMPWLCY